MTYIEKQKEEDEKNLKQIALSIKMWIRSVPNESHYQKAHEEFKQLLHSRDQALRVEAYREFFEAIRGKKKDFVNIHFRAGYDYLFNEQSALANKIIEEMEVEK